MEQFVEGMINRVIQICVEIAPNISADAVWQKLGLMPKVVSFSGPTEPFSNYYPVDVKIDGKTWPSTEHYFQAMKFSNYPRYMEIIRLADTPNKAKLLGTQSRHRFGGTWLVSKNHPELGTINQVIDDYRGVTIVRDWEAIKEGVMLVALRAKFTQHPNLASLLLRTGDAYIEERSKTDSYWGVTPRGGKNALGKLLMRVRKEIS